MRVFKIRQILNQRGLLLFGTSDGWLITNEGTVKTLIEHTFDDLEAVEAWVAALPNRMTAEEGDVFDKEFEDFVEAEAECGRAAQKTAAHFLHAHQIIESWPKWKRRIKMRMGQRLWEGNMSKKTKYRRIRVRKQKMSLLPYYFYLAGSLCFAVGTLIVIVRCWGKA